MATEYLRSPPCSEVINQSEPSLYVDVNVKVTAPFHACRAKWYEWQPADRNKVRISHQKHSLLMKYGSHSYIMKLSLCMIFDIESMTYLFPWFWRFHDSELRTTSFVCSQWPVYWTCWTCMHAVCTSNPSNENRKQASTESFMSVRVLLKRMSIYRILPCARPSRCSTRQKNHVGPGMINFILLNVAPR